MSLVTVLVILAIVGVALSLLNAVVPMDAKIRAIVNAIVVIVVLLWLLEIFGLVSPLPLRVGKVGLR